MSRSRAGRVVAGQMGPMGPMAIGVEVMVLTPVSMHVIPLSGADGQRNVSTGCRSDRDGGKSGICGQAGLSVAS